MAPADSRGRPAKTADRGSAFGDRTINGCQAAGQIKGLYIYRDLIPEELLDALLQHIQKEGWFNPQAGRNQAMRFGRFPVWLDPLVQLAHACLPCEFGSRKPVFDQMIANHYVPGEGLISHVDLLDRFDDGIIVASIQGTCVMEFRPRNVFRERGENIPQSESFFLRAGDVICLSGPARWDWEHGIPARMEDLDGFGDIVRRVERVSITLRKLLPNACFE
ncbi:uncharacterized protein EV422DRAFT_494933 [Fimicolochytrium jonesii]|uniref:uncharacterized protein n=1 Tax=Fimicolochytrium jonesii TaxID=1396493 RepID=UPI0022FEBFED|nr:uncharacterized protein EV422DRAFT_494933 [Fimicolochytrium jonesii]KAI8822092.1 hypothetical protein EV422DRAFT_494933 [Fimicolochytrium jonesii]